MNPVLVATALTVVAGAIVALAARDARVALIGLAASLAAAPLLADPLPEPAAIVARVIAAALAGELLWIAVRETTTVARGSSVGWLADALAAGAAFVVGVAVSGGLGRPDATELRAVVAGAAAAAPGDGAPIVVGTALALLAVSITPLVRGRDPLRLGIAATLLIMATTVLRAGVLGTPSSFEELVVAGLFVTTAAAAAVVTMRTTDGRPAIPTDGPAPRTDPAR